MKFLVLTLVTFLAGCSLTHEEKQALAASMHSAGQAMHQETQRMIYQSQNQQNIIQPIAPIPMNCFTTYNSMMRAYETRCQ